MKRSLLLIAAAAMLMSACTVINPAASNMVNITGVNFTGYQLKKGEDCAMYVLGMGPFGTNSLINAAKNGNVTRVAYVEYQFQNYFLFGKQCTEAYGQ